MHGRERPLSPHLQVYRWQITMWLSSLHRITGLLLSLGAVALGVWLIAIASGSAAYADIQGLFAGWAFKALLVVWTFCFFLHLSNGVRHLFWDAGAGFERSSIRASGIAVLLVTFGATAAFTLFAIV